MSLTKGVLKTWPTAGSVDLEVHREKVHHLALVSSRTEPQVWLKPHRDELLSSSEVTGQGPISIMAVLSDEVTHISSQLLDY